LIEQGLPEILEQGIATQLRRQAVDCRPQVAAHQADDLEPGQPVIGSGVALPHVADADDEDADRARHNGLPWRYPCPMVSAAPTRARPRARISGYRRDLANT